MSDVLDRLRGDNPVPIGSPPSFQDVWAGLQRESGAVPRSGPVRRTRAMAVGVLAVIPVALVSLIAVTTLAHRPQAAGSGNPTRRGLLAHYRARTVYRPAASGGASFAYEVDSADVWVWGAVRHRIDTAYFYSGNGRRQGAALRLELMTDGRRLEHFQAGSLASAGELDESSAGVQDAPCLLIVDCASAVSVDPAAEVKHLYQTGALMVVARGKRLNGRPVDELKSANARTTRVYPVVIIFVDVRSFLPVEIVAQYGPRPWPADPASTTTISDYQRLQPTAGNRRLLQMRPHPGAKLLCDGPGGAAPSTPAPAHGCP